MKITLLTLEYPPMYGGVGNYYAGLVKRLREQNITVNVIVFPQNTRWWKVLLRVLWVKTDYFWIGHILPLGTAAYVMKILRRTKFFISLHGMDINLALRNKSRLTKRLMHKASFITVNSMYTASIVDKLVAENSILNVYPCPNVNESIDSAIENNLISKYKLENKKNILSVCRLVERKGLQRVIKLMPELLKDDENTHYFIIGKGEYQEELDRLIVDLGLQESVEVLNNINNEELKVFYRHADVFVMPTKELNGDIEGFGIVYLEAGLYNTPVIATPVGGATEAVIDKQTGLLCQPNDLKENIIRLLTDVDYATKLGKQARELIKVKYSYSKQATKLIDKLEDGGK